MTVGEVHEPITHYSVFYRGPKQSLSSEEQLNISAMSGVNCSTTHPYNLFAATNKPLYLREYKHWLAFLRPFRDLMIVCNLFFLLFMEKDDFLWVDRNERNY